MIASPMRPKKRPARPQPNRTKHRIPVELPPDMLAAFKYYCDHAAPRIKYNAQLETLIRKFLIQSGLWDADTDTSRVPK